MTVLLCNFHPSVPLGTSPLATVNIITSAINSDLSKCVVLVIDVTIEKYELESIMSNVINTLTHLLDSHKLCLVFSKSFQKYATLGLAKSMAGTNIVFFGTGFRTASESTFFMARLAELEANSQAEFCDDFQLVSHILDCSSESELLLTVQAGLNSQYVCYNLMQPTWGDALTANSGLPFIAFDKACSRWTIQIGNTQKLMYLANLVGSLALEDRDSFSSINTSFLSMTLVVRLNIGQESKAELIEKLFAFGTLLQPQSRNIDSSPVIITWNSVTNFLFFIVTICRFLKEFWQFPK